ncbi:hypothetical protein SK128_021044, partial [Halocaridina rubra]
FPSTSSMELAFLPYSMPGHFIIMFQMNSRYLMLCSLTAELTGHYDFTVYKEHGRKEALRITFENLSGCSGPDPGFFLTA